MTSRTTPVLLLLMVLASPALGQLLGIGSCPSVTAMANIDTTSLLGTWYEYKRYSNSFELGSKCVTANFETAADNSTVDITVSLTNFLTRKETIAEGTALQTSSDGSGVFTLNFPDINASGAVTILGSDYDNYAVAWSCKKILGIFHYKYSWLLSREKSPSKEVINKMKAVLKSNNLSTLFYIKTLQSCN
ncbi:apolipoprotein D-like [Schistocerca cancellata]|uniref:apolipoprotein D-like n=1 Tax=Schistocerca cancellata TaxID=274614 RepID=UPI002117C159|nr:apolipoprotein D-like [Schistocerca cancellata]XP_049773142.1 apolipoprotein D-like [Schistocerca cancellata]